MIFDLLLMKLYSKMKNQREEFILSSIASLSPKVSKTLVLGGCEGVFVNKVMKRLGLKTIYTVDIDSKYVDILKKNSAFIVSRADLNEKFPYKNSYFNLVVADQIIEHIIDLDNFISEIYRILRINGKAIISTENLASFANILSLVLGYRPFSIHYSSRINIGNPLSPHNGHIIKSDSVIGAIHHKIFTPKALKDLLKFYNFRIIKEFYNGFIPFSTKSEKFFGNHAFFMSYLVSKKNG